jgi:hypothetical protein
MLVFQKRSSVVVDFVDADMAMAITLVTAAACGHSLICRLVLSPPE